MTYFFNIIIYIYIYVDIFIIVFYLPYYRYCNIRYVVLSFDEIKTHYYYYYYIRLPNRNRKSNFCKLNKSIIKINIKYFIVKRTMQF